MTLPLPLKDHGTDDHATTDDTAAPHAKMHALAATAATTSTDATHSTTSPAATTGVNVDGMIAKFGILLFVTSASALPRIWRVAASNYLPCLWVGGGGRDRGVLWQSFCH